MRFCTTVVTVTGDGRDTRAINSRAIVGIVIVIKEPLA